MNQYCVKSNCKWFYSLDSRRTYCWTKKHRITILLSIIVLNFYYYIFFNFRSNFSCESTRKFTTHLLPLLQDITDELYTSLKIKFNISDLYNEAWKYYKDLSSKPAKTHNKEFIDLAITYGTYMDMVSYWLNRKRMMVQCQSLQHMTITNESK